MDSALNRGWWIQYFSLKNRRIKLKKREAKNKISYKIIVTQKINKMVMHDASGPQEKFGNNIVRAQFIVPLQHNYNQKTKRYNKKIIIFIWNFKFIVLI